MMEEKEFHRKADRLAIEMEATIAQTEHFINSLPEFESSRSKRAVNLHTRTSW